MPKNPVWDWFFPSLSTSAGTRSFVDRRIPGIGTGSPDGTVRPKRPFPPGLAGRNLVKKGGEGFYFDQETRRSEPVLKVKWVRIPEPVHLLGNNALPRAHLPLPPPGPGLEEGGGGGVEAERLFFPSPISGAVPPAGSGAAGKAEKTRVEIIRSDLFPRSDSSFERLPNGSFCLSESFSSRFCSD